MTYDANQPNASLSPGLFPSGGNTNFSRLKTLINAEHIFNDTAAADDGCHRQMTMVARADPVSLPAGTNGMLFLKTVGPTVGLFLYDGATVTPITSVSSVTALARVNWNNNGVVIGTPFNATVTKVSSGVFQVNFTSPLPSTSVQYSIGIVEPSSNIAVPKIQTFTTSAMRIKFANQNNTAIGTITQGSLIVFG